MKDEPPVVLDGIGGFLAGTANVIMQLSLAPVGYGVIESKVDSGKVTKHPLKRFRTTFTYISVALWGNEQDRARYRTAVNGSHRLVRSDENSPVPYNAFDKDLQLWVAACLYYGTVDIIEKLHGPLPDEQADALYEYGARYGTTLQVTPDMWPADRKAFGKYWDETLTEISIAEPVREYLNTLATRAFMRQPMRGSTRFNKWLTIGFLPEPFRAEMRYTWTTADQVKFDRLLRRIGAVQRRLPGVVRRFPFNYFLWDMRLRVRFNRRLV